MNENEKTEFAKMWREARLINTDNAVYKTELSKATKRLADYLLNGYGDIIKKEISEAENAQIVKEAKKESKIHKFFRKLFRICSQET